MSYCRWSSMDWECDLYIYDAGEFISVNVAGRRRKFDETWPRMKTNATIDEQFAIWQAQHDWLKAHEDEKEWIDLNTVTPEFAGEGYDIADPDEVADLLVRMRDAGLRFPDGLIEEFREQEQK